MNHPKYIFIYGTLRHEFNHEMHNLLKQFGKLIGRGYYQGKLYDFGDYPGAVASRNPLDRIKGEVYRLEEPEKVLELLDDYEGVKEVNSRSPEYIRKIVTVILEDGKKLKTWIYLYNHLITHSHFIASGDYYLYRAKKSEIS